MKYFSDKSPSFPPKELPLSGELLKIICDEISTWQPNKKEALKIRWHLYEVIIPIKYIVTRSYARGPVESKAIAWQGLGEHLNHKVMELAYLYITNTFSCERWVWFLSP